MTLKGLTFSQTLLTLKTRPMKKVILILSLSFSLTSFATLYNCVPKMCIDDQALAAELYDDHQEQLVCDEGVLCDTSIHPKCQSQVDALINAGSWYCGEVYILNQ